MHDRPNLVKLPPLTIVQHRLTMRAGMTVSGLTFLTTLFFKTKSTSLCYHLPIFALSSVNTVYPRIETALVGPVKTVLL